MYIFKIKCGETELRRRLKARHGRWEIGVRSVGIGPFFALELTSAEYPDPIRTPAARINCWIRKGQVYCTDVPISPAALWLFAILAVIAALLLSRHPGERFFIGLVSFLVLNAMYLVPAYLDTKRHDYIAELLGALNALCEAPAAEKEAAE